MGLNFNFDCKAFTYWYDSYGLWSSFHTNKKYPIVYIYNELNYAANGEN